PACRRAPYGSRGVRHPCETNHDGRSAASSRPARSSSDSRAYRSCCSATAEIRGIYAMVAHALTRGGMPYRDAWDFKPPGIFLVHAGARVVFGPALIGIRLLEVIGLVATSAGMVKLATRFWGEPRIGWIAAALAVLAHGQL